MTTQITTTNRNPEFGGASASGDYYEGTVDGKPFRVSISPLAAPHWYDSDLDDDERADVLAEIGD